MAAGSFEVSGSPHLLKGTIAADVYELGGVAPTNIIRIDEAWKVSIDWELIGSLKSMVCGTWCLHLHLESIGKGEELDLFDGSREVHVKLDPCGNGQYHYDFTVPAGTVKPEHCSTPYKLVTTLTYLNECGRPGPMAGFVEGQILQFYDPGITTP
ncbi:hypothetical protein SE17_22980 [Kouleothrix aurantiaca]|uniref:Uncharacterized protein n=1 Tax=Kouleothrix aurantiaca TaxID=186479 RepID=A0A0P9HA25_9CHLR|nr:hypothetical protein SE17_22980 [Kouleothrix aurantiaca]